jgi:N-acetylglucosamine-6-sulfatase
VTAPNLLIITTDDQRYDEMIYMPQTRKLARTGTQFTACRTNVPLCSPARAGIFSGQYSRYHAVLTNSNNPSTTITDNSVFVALHNAGYRTGMIGKFFAALLAHPVATGFDFWRTIAGDGGSGYGIYEPTTYTIYDGSAAWPGGVVSPGTYQEDYLKSQALTFVAGTQPWVLWYCPTNPHWPFVSPPSHKYEWLGRDWTTSLESDVTDKPSWIQALPAPSGADLIELQSEQRERLRELLAVDDTVAALAAAVPGNTTIIFTSDNGNMLGEHRLVGASGEEGAGAIAGTKNILYDAAMRVPLFAVGANFPAKQIVTQPTTHQDITATMIDLGAATALLGNQAGVSLKTIAASPASYNSRQLLHYRDTSGDANAFPTADAITTMTRKLIRHQGKTGTDQFEMYDLDTDPGELVNVANVGGRLTERNALETSLNTLLA